MSTSRPEPKRVARERLAEEREKQQAAEKARERTLRLLVIGVVVLLVVGIAGLVFWQQNKPVDASVIPTGADPKTGAISVGAGPVSVQFWEDFQCPACAAFEGRVGDTVNELVADDSITAEYYLLTFLDANLGNDSSLRAANAAGCASDAGKFPEYHATVYANQPAEEGAGFTDAQLLQFGKDVGIEGDAYTEFETCVQDVTYREWTQAVAQEQAGANVTSTPTVFINGEQLPREDYTAEGLKKAVENAS
jgi:protein-disulfide isomerase